MIKSLTKESIQNFSKELGDIFGNNKYVVFLCGPTLQKVHEDAGAALRLRIKEALEQEGFEVVLGEDDGLEELRGKYSGMAHENELQFIKSQCNSVVLIASSVGSFCELGLFSHQHVRENSRNTDFILILDEKYKGEKSYLNQGPARAIEDYGKLIHASFDQLDIAVILNRLNNRRHVWLTRSKGRLGL